MTRAAIVLLVLATAHAHADTGAWNGFRSLGVPDDQLAALRSVAAENLKAGGLVNAVVSDDRIAERCGVAVECHCESLRKRGLRYGAFGSMGRLGDLWTIELTLIDAHGCTVENTTFASESLADSAVPLRLADLARRLTTPADAIAETATGSQRSIDMTPAVVITFTRAQLRALQIRSLDDLLPLVPGYEVVDANWGGLILNQGLQNSLLFMSNGIPLVNGLNNFRALGRDFSTTLTHVDRIEVVRGPGSVLWGQNAFLGVINLITDIPTRREASVEAGVLAGSLDTEKVWARGGQNRGSYGFVASIDAGRRFGPTTRVKDSPQAVVGIAPIPFGNGGTTHPTADTWLDVLLRIAIGKQIDIFVQNLTTDLDYEISPFGPLLDEHHGGYWKKTHRLYAVTGTQPLYAEPGASVVARVRGSRYEYFSQENFAVQPVFPDGPVPNPGQRDFRLGLRSLQGNDHPRAANQFEARVTHDYKDQIASQLTGGIGVLHLHTPVSFATLSGIDEEPATQVQSFGPKDFFTVSAFAIEELVPLSWLVVSAGARVQLDRPYVASDPWRFTTKFQGGAAMKRGPFGAKLTYAEGFRPPDAVQVFSTVGTRGNKDLVPESSRDLGAEIHFEVDPALTLRAGGDLIRISNGIVFVPILNDPVFAQDVFNQARIDVATASVGARVSTGKVLDGFANYQITAMDESIPTGNGIPIARHTASLGVVWRPLPDLSVFARGAFSSPRKLVVRTAADPAAIQKTSPTVRSAIGATISNVFTNTDLEVSIDNPLMLEHDAPYRLDGAPVPLVERRRGTEVFASLRYTR